MKRILLLCLGFLLILTACNDDYYYDDDGVNGVRNNRSSQNSSSLSNDAVAFYLIKNYNPQQSFHPDSIELESQAFISYDEIVAYDSAAHVFELELNNNSSYSGIYEFDLKGFVLMVDDDTIFNGLIVSPMHSQIFDFSIVLTSYLGETGGKPYLELLEAYPSSLFAMQAIDLNDQRLIARLEADHKLKKMISKTPEPGPKPLFNTLDTLYYYEDIFKGGNENIYGKWELMSISGGIQGTGCDSDFSYLEFIPYGIYQFVQSDTLLEFGKIVIEEQSAEVLRITLKPDSLSTHFFMDSEKIVVFDTYKKLNLFAPCCDRFNYHFQRIE